jgi:hypothetical protein
VVTWASHVADAHSVTTWSGQYDPDQDMIFATWLLTNAHPDGQGRWHATTVGQDWFARQPHPEGVVRRYFEIGRASHPEAVH